MHGGKAPQVERANARRVLDELVGPALVQLRRLVEDDSIPANVKLAAVRDVLDRAGFKPTEKVEVTHLTEDLLDAEIARLEAELAKFDG